MPKQHLEYCETVCQTEALAQGANFKTAAVVNVAVAPSLNTSLKQQNVLQKSSSTYIYVGMYVCVSPIFICMTTPTLNGNKCVG